MKKRILLLALVLCTVFCLAVACDFGQVPQKEYTVSYVCDTTGAVTNKDFTYATGVTTLTVPVTLAEGYTQSKLSVTYTIGDGEPVAAEVVNGEITITNPIGNIVVTVSGAALNEYKVSFVLGDEVKHTATVKHGSKLTDADLDAAKQAVTAVGYEFVKWTDAVDVAITSNTTIHAETNKVNAVVTFVNGNEKHQVSATIGQALSAEQIDAAKAALVAEGYHFVSFDVADLETKVIDGDLTVNVTTEINKYTVTIKLDGEVKATIANVEHGATLTEAQIAEAQQAVATEGYHVTWDKDLATTAITDDTTFAATSEINAYTVTIVLGEKTITTYQVNHGAALTADQIAEAESLVNAQIDKDHKFTGWSADLTATITDDTTIEAQQRELYKFDVTFTAEPSDALAMVAEEYEAYTEGEPVNFTLEFAAAYTQNADRELVVSYSMGDVSGTLQRNEDGSYTIEAITADVSINVAGLKINTYTVKFVANDTDNPITIVNGVAHGSTIDDGVLDEVAAYKAVTLEVWGHGYNGEPITADTTINVVYATAITSAEQYLAIEQEGNYFLAADIDMGNNIAPVWGNVAWTADPETCGDAKNGEYRGTFDGRNHTLTFNRTEGSLVALGDYGLMFYRLAGTVKNVNVNATLSGAYYANVFTAVTRELCNGTIENVNVTLNTVGASLGYPGTQLTALVGNFCGGTVRNCSVTLNTAVYKLVDEHVAAIGSIKSWLDADGNEYSKTVNGLALHLPANLDGIAALGTLADVPYLAKDKDTDDAITISGYTVDYTAAKDNDFLWETATDIAALGDSTLYTESDITAPRGFEKVYKSNGTYNNASTKFLCDELLEKYTKVAFGIRTSNYDLCNNVNWEGFGALNGWAIFVAERNSDGTWTLVVHKTTPSGEVAYTYENLSATKVSALYSYANCGNIGDDEYPNGRENTLYSTELRVVDDPDYVPMTSLGVSALLSSTLQADEVAPEGFTSVYKSDNKYGAANYVAYLANLNLEQYNKLYFALKTDLHDLTEKNTWNLHEIKGQWGYYTCVKNADGTWAVTLTRSNSQILKISDGIIATSMSDLFTYLDDKWGNVENATNDNTFWATEVWATADPNYVAWSKIADTALANPTEPTNPSIWELSYPYDFTVMTRTNAEVEVPYNWDGYSGGAAFLADTDISAYSQVKFAIMTPTTGYRDYPWNGGVGNWNWGLFMAKKQTDGTWTLTVSVNGNVNFTITSISATKLSDLYRMQSMAEGTTSQLIYSTEVYAK